MKFNQIPIDMRVPGSYIEIDNSQAFRGLSGMPARVNIIGQKIATGIAEKNESVMVLTADAANKLFGAGSQLAAMATKLLDALPGIGVEIWATPQEDADASTAATGNILYGGTIKAGVAYLYIGGYRLAIGIAADDTLANIASNTVDAINDANIAVSAAINGVTDGQVDLTARNKGEEANNLDIRFSYHADETLPEGLTTTITAMSGGAGNPDITEVFAAWGSEWYTDIAVPYTDAANLTALKTEMADRYNALAAISAHAYLSIAGTHAELITEGQNHNSPHVTFLPFDKSPTATYECAAILTGVAAFHAKQDPARQMRGAILKGILAPVVSKRFSMQERDLLLRYGMSTWGTDADNNVRIERLITTYRENQVGAADPSYLDVTTVKTVAYLRYDTNTHISLRYPNWKLADDGTNVSRGDNVMTPSTMRSTLIGRFKKWEEQGLVEGLDQFKRDLIIERDDNDPNRLNAIIPPDIINNMRVFAGSLQFRV